ncbi:MAG: EFR1 family ferrodoxin [Clostridia bacterium]|jgi:ferredoxin|nr:EFR1 family ferrodoxin [Clostridia bacterium]
MKNVCTFYFSATGTTEKIVNTIADTIAEKLGTNVVPYDFTLPKARKEPKTFTENDIVICATPTYAGRVPNVLLKYLDTVKGNGALAVPVVLYGNRNYDDSLIELRNILEKDGFHTIAGGAFVGEHSFSYTLAAGRPDEKDIAVAKEFAAKIADRILNNNIPSSPCYVKGNDPIRPYYTPRDRKGNPVNILKVKPLTSDKCTNCGTCAAVCPMGSINPENVREFIGICIKCGACVKKCPKGAKYYDDPKYLYHKEELELGYTRRAEPEYFI